MALSRLSRLDILQQSFVQLRVPPAVAREVGTLPNWLTVTPMPDPRREVVFPSHIHAGEAEVIELGLAIPEAVLVIDDWAARRVAQNLGLRVIGTNGLLLRAKREGRISEVRTSAESLIAAGFHIGKRTLEEALRLAGEA